MNAKQIIDLQRKYLSQNKASSVEERIHHLKKLKEVIISNEEKLLEAVAKDLSKSKYEAYITEIVPLYKEINIFCKKLKSWARPKRVSSPLHLWPSKAMTFKDPYGLVGVFAPWNYPIQLLLLPAIGSIAAGNCTLLKPADLTPHTQKALIELINNNFEPGFLYVMGGGIPECEELLKEKLDFIFFTGSPRVGKVIMTAAAQHLTPVCLELGGKSPCIIDENINLLLTAKRITWSKFLNAGQTCAAPDYFYVHKNIKTKFIEAIKQEIQNTFGPKPLESQNLGNIINSTHFERIKSYLEPKNIAHGGASNSETKKIEPTILDNINWNSLIMQDEIFGPIIPILEFEYLDEVISEIIERPKPLALYIFSESKIFQNMVLSNTTSGGGCVNDCIVHLGNSNLPFGGVGNSGMGAYHGKHSFETMSHTKSYQYTSTFFDNPMRYFKNTKFKIKLINWLFK